MPRRALPKLARMPNLKAKSAAITLFAVLLGCDSGQAYNSVLSRLRRYTETRGPLRASRTIGVGPVRSGFSSSYTEIIL